MSSLSTLPSGPPWFIYMIRLGNGHLYTGISLDPARRLLQHQGIKAGGAKALRGKAPLQLIWQHQVPNKMIASQLEYQLKRWSKSDKEALITDTSGLKWTQLMQKIPARHAVFADHKDDVDA